MILADRRRLHRDILEIAYRGGEVSQRLDVVLLGRPPGAEIDGDIFARSLQSVESVSELLPVPPADDDLIGSKISPLGLTSGFVGPLAVRLSAIPLRAPGPTGGFERSSTPSTVP